MTRSNLVKIVLVGAGVLGVTLVIKKAPPGNVNPVVPPV